MNYELHSSKLIDLQTMSLLNKKLMIFVFCLLTLVMISFFSVRLKSATSANESHILAERRRMKFSYRKKLHLSNQRKNIQEKLIFNTIADNEKNYTQMLSHFENVEESVNGPSNDGESVKNWIQDIAARDSDPRNITDQETIKVMVDYLVANKDPRSEKLLKKLLTSITDDLYHKFFMKIKVINQNSKVDFKNLPFQQQWKMLIPIMRELGYEQKLPTAINIGVKKSGTNAFGFFFQQHPQVCHSLGNEVHYFDWNHDKGTGYYKSRMGFATKHQISFEKTPRYFVTENAPVYIKEELPENVKFILCVRDPVERLISDFRHESELLERRQTRGKIERKKYLSHSGNMEGLKFQKQVLTASGVVNASNELIRTSIYNIHFQNWLKVYPRDRLLIINHDDLQSNALHELQRVERFLGLKPYFKKDMFYYDESRHGFCMKGKPRPCPAKSTPGFLPKAQLNQTLFKTLYDFYRPHNQAFAKLIGKRYDWMDR